VSRDQAKKWYDPQPDDASSTAAYIGPQDAKNSLDQVYNDMVQKVPSSLSLPTGAGHGNDVVFAADSGEFYTWDPSSAAWRVKGSLVLRGTAAGAAKHTSTVSTRAGTALAVAHGLGTTAVVVGLWQAGEQVLADVAVTDANTVTVRTAADETDITVVVVG
jgi:hypothetical protein